MACDSFCQKCWAIPSLVVASVSQEPLLRLIFDFREAVEADPEKSAGAGFQQLVSRMNKLLFFAKALPQDRAFAAAET